MCVCAHADLVSDSRQSIYQLLQPFVSLSHLHDNTNPDYTEFIPGQQCCLSHMWPVHTFRNTPITARPFSSITASSNKLYLSEFQWTKWS